MLTKKDKHKLSPVNPNVIPCDRGPRGFSGTDGATGMRGATGKNGPQGSKGDIGPRGPKGSTGERGHEGHKGNTGDRGATGLAGTIIGTRDIDNILAINNPSKGDIWIAKNDDPTASVPGVTGDGYVFEDNKWVNFGQIRGPIGPEGVKGNEGIQGNSGITGPAGPTGPQGNQGNKGDKGDTGKTGDGLYMGKTYDTFTQLEQNNPNPSLGETHLVLHDSAGNVLNHLFSFSNPNPPHDISGASWFDIGSFKGEDGKQGPAGPVGQGGPTGATGAKGDTGLTGAQGAIGPQGPTGPQGPAGGGASLNPADQAKLDHLEVNRDIDLDELNPDFVYRVRKNIMEQDITGSHVDKPGTYFIQNQNELAIIVPNDIPGAVPTKSIFAINEKGEFRAGRTVGTQTIWGGASGTFKTADSKTVTVVNGLITEIV